MIVRLLVCFSLFVALPAMADTPASPKINAGAWLLADHDTGMRLSEFRSDKTYPTGHLNKLMVAYASFKAIASGELLLDSPVAIGAKARNVAGPRMFAPVETAPTVADVLQAIIVGRANDAALALAEHIASDEQAFVSRMNDYAVMLGMTQTHYRNVSGRASARQITSADDTFTLASALINEFPEYYPWFAKRELALDGIKLYNRNALLWRDDSVDGLIAFDNGRAGFNLVVSAKRGSMRLTAVVLGSPNERAGISAAQQLLKFGFERYETRRLYAREVAAVNLRTWLGDRETLPVGVQQDLYLTLPRGEFDQLQAKLQINGSLFAPIPEGQIMGKLSLYNGENRIGEHPLVALETVSEGGFIRRAFDHIEMWLRDIPDQQTEQVSQ
ncbi:MAG: D-alanyl-D-alanine carboxypeptidase [Acidiferrobacterales bacterium]|jgi:D-alanyl-D-alanine carboxypeptidase (penicillin-binding protein 5/6)|nr:D-alanyl-D-alanine carboxypeptidase [Acidiferrobacterales bacterium]